METAGLSLIVRDFEENQLRRRLDALESYARAVEAAFPGGKVTIRTQKQ